jgi:hypothetical protein
MKLICKPRNREPGTGNRKAGIYTYLALFAYTPEQPTQVTATISTLTLTLTLSRRLRQLQTRIGFLSRGFGTTSMAAPVEQITLYTAKVSR